MIPRNLYMDHDQSIAIVIRLNDDCFVPISVVSVLFDHNRLSVIAIAIAITVTITIGADCYASGTDADTDFFGSGRNCAGAHNRGSGDY